MEKICQERLCAQTLRTIRERYTSRVTLDRPRRIDVEYLEGPLKRLTNHWVFEPHESGGTCLHFFMDFEFRSRVLQALIGALFYEALRRLVAAFEVRARKLYWPRVEGVPSAGRT